MKFCVPSKTFYNYASAVNKVINSKNALTVLNNFLMTLEGDTVTLTGSDVENQLTARIPVTDAQGSGSVCVDARRMVELLKEIPDQGLTVEVDSNYKVRISYSNGGCEFVAIDGIEFPAAKRDEEDTAEPVSFTCPSKVLSRGIENTLFAATTDDYRPVMMGVFFDIKPDGITFVATDTRKLVKYTDNNCQPNVTARQHSPQRVRRRGGCEADTDSQERHHRERIVCVQLPFPAGQLPGLQPRDSPQQHAGADR